MDKIQVFDNYFTETQHKFILKYCCWSSYKYGEIDDIDKPPTGLSHDIPPSEEIYSLIERSIEELMGPEASKYQLYCMYVNCFAPGENPYFHTDGPEGDLTFLYYPTIHWHPNEGGETQIYENDMMTGVPPIPNRMVVFDAALLHRATSFRSTHRFTIAIKYKMVRSL